MICRVLANRVKATYQPQLDVLILFSPRVCYVTIVLGYSEASLWQSSYPALNLIDSSGQIPNVFLVSTRRPGRRKMEAKGWNSGRKDVHDKMQTRSCRSLFGLIRIRYHMVRFPIESVLLYSPWPLNLKTRPLEMTNISWSFTE